jgi:mannose-6-phosphate isomerase-like protein (cupin superfamily)
VLATRGRTQYVAMRLREDQTIPLERHPDNRQVILVLDGSVLVSVGEHPMFSAGIPAGGSVTVEPGTWHAVRNLGPGDAVLITTYTPPEHETGLVEYRSGSSGKTGKPRKPRKTRGRLRSRHP